VTIAMNALARLTGTASGGMAIALNLGDTFMTLARKGINPELLPDHHDDAGTRRAHQWFGADPAEPLRADAQDSYLDMVMTVIVVHRRARRCADSGFRVQLR
jgi:hypothetical protein